MDAENRPRPGEGILKLRLNRAEVSHQPTGHRFAEDMPAPRGIGGPSPADLLDTSFVHDRVLV